MYKLHCLYELMWDFDRFPLLNVFINTSVKWMNRYF